MDDRRGIWIAAGAAGALAARVAMHRAILTKLRGDVRELNAGRHEQLLASYAPDAVLRFNEGSHRWAGEHRGKAAIDRFLRNFTAAGIQGEIKELYVAGPLWRLTFLVRFDDEAVRDGAQIYRNRTVLVIKTRFGRIVEHEDFYEDTERITRFDRRLDELGVPPVAA